MTFTKDSREGIRFDMEGGCRVIETTSLFVWRVQLAFDCGDRRALGSCAHLLELSGPLFIQFIC